MHEVRNVATQTTTKKMERTTNTQTEGPDPPGDAQQQTTIIHKKLEQ